MPKPKVYPDTEGSVYQAWCPMWGFFDIRWAAAYTPSDNNDKRYDTDLDVYVQGDLDEKTFLCVGVFA